MNDLNEFKSTQTNSTANENENNISFYHFTIFWNANNKMLFFLRAIVITVMVIMLLQLLHQPLSPRLLKSFKNKVMDTVMVVIQLQHLPQ